jgi:hypothetical protein
MCVVFALCQILVPATTRNEKSFYLTNMEKSAETTDNPNCNPDDNTPIGKPDGKAADNAKR